jgi:hypothetical protein
LYQIVNSFLPYGQWHTLGNFLKITKTGQFLATFFTGNVYVVWNFTETGWDTFWAMFSQTHLATLYATSEQIFKKCQKNFHWNSFSSVIQIPRFLKYIHSLRSVFNLRCLHFLKQKKSQKHNSVLCSEPVGDNPKCGKIFNQRLM